PPPFRKTAPIWPDAFLERFRLTGNYEIMTFWAGIEIPISAMPGGVLSCSPVARRVSAPTRPLMQPSRNARLDTQEGLMGLELSAEERALLLNILERADRHLLAEIHRTESIDFRHGLEHDEETLLGLLEKVRAAAPVENQESKVA